jgi:hypothetical protein
MGVVSRSFSDIYVKNKDDLYSLFFRKYPEFVFKNIEVLKKNEICVFVFHQVEVELFEKQILFLVKNGYKTLNSQELVSFLKGDIHSDGKHVVLTFDDGHISIFTIIYPLLKKYGLTGVSFIVPGLVDPGSGLSLTLEDFWTGNANLEQIVSISCENKMCNWDEIKTMHQSGIIDFQSHTNNHNCVFISDKVVDFISPWSDYSYFSQRLYSPVFGADDKDFTADAKFLGQPIYRYAPKMSSHLRYIENPRCMPRCGLPRKSNRNSIVANLETRSRLRAVVDHHVDRRRVEAWQHVKLSLTNCSIGFQSDPPHDGKRRHRAPKPRLPNQGLPNQGNPNQGNPGAGENGPTETKTTLHLMLR